MSYNQGRESRKQRITKKHNGGWGSSSQDFARLAFMLFEQSACYAKKVDGNCSIYTLSGIPMLFSALRCLLVELNMGMHSQKQIVSSGNIATSANDVYLIVNNYKLPKDLKEELRYLAEIRNEIIHPSHMPTGTDDNTPLYLNIVKEKGLLQSTGGSSDYTWISQLQSHKLFQWAFEIIASTTDLLLKQHEVSKYIHDGISESYGRFRSVDF